MRTRLIALADALDRKGLIQEANEIDRVVKAFDYKTLFSKAIKLIDQLGGFDAVKNLLLEYANKQEQQASAGAVVEASDKMALLKVLLPLLLALTGMNSTQLLANPDKVLSPLEQQFRDMKWNDTQTYGEYSDSTKTLREKEALNAFEDKSLGFLERMKALKEWHRSQGGHYEFTLGPHTFNASSSRDVYYYVTDPEKGLGFRINSATLNQIPVK